MSTAVLSQELAVVCPATCLFPGCSLSKSFSPLCHNPHRAHVDADGGAALGPAGGASPRGAAPQAGSKLWARGLAGGQAAVTHLPGGGDLCWHASSPASGAARSTALIADAAPGRCRCCHLLPAPLRAAALQHRAAGSPPGCCLPGSLSKEEVVLKRTCLYSAASHCQPVRGRGGSPPAESGCGMRLSRGRQGRTAPIACPAASTSGGADCWGGGPYCGGTKRWPLPQESVLQCMLDEQSGQNLHFLCKSLKQVGDCFLLGLQMDTIWCSVQKNLSHLQLFSVTDSLFDISYDVILYSWSSQFSGQSCCLGHVHLVFMCPDPEQLKRAETDGVANQARTGRHAAGRLQHTEIPAVGWWIAGQVSLHCYFLLQWW